MARNDDSEPERPKESSSLRFRGEPSSLLETERDWITKEPLVNGQQLAAFEDFVPRDGATGRRIVTARVREYFLLIVEWRLADERRALQQSCDPIDAWPELFAGDFETETSELANAAARA